MCILCLYVRTAGVDGRGAAYGACIANAAAVVVDTVAPNGSSRDGSGRECA